MERVDKKIKSIEKEISSLRDFMITFERKNETYWGILKSLINTLKEEVNGKISKEYFDKFFLNDIAELKAQ